MTFADVAGVDEAKEELKEIVAFLKEPSRIWPSWRTHAQRRAPGGFSGHGQDRSGQGRRGRIGGAVFFSGSKFVEMFVGVGAARVRDLFEQARDKAPTIIFIDELDAGCARGIGPFRAKEWL